MMLRCAVGREPRRRHPSLTPIMPGRADPPCACPTSINSSPRGPSPSSVPATAPAPSAAGLSQPPGRDLQGRSPTRSTPSTPRWPGSPATRTWRDRQAGRPGPDRHSRGQGGGHPRPVREYGVKVAVVYTAGFAEQRGQGHGLTGAHGGRGAAQPHPRPRAQLPGGDAPPSALNASFGQDRPRRGNVALVSQSGAVSTAMLDWSERRQAPGLLRRGLAGRRGGRGLRQRARLIWPWTARATASCCMWRGCETPAAS